MKQLIQTYMSHLLKVNETINLTRITDPHQVQLLHIEDSLAVLPEVDDAPEGLYGDMGSGGGIPGVPIAIATGRHTLLIDSVKKKMTAVQKILDTMQLSDQIHTYSGRLETLATIKPEEFSVLTARALSKLPSLMELAVPLLRQNGRLICLKSHITEDEIHQSQNLLELLGLEMTSRRSYYLEDNYREVIVFTKVGNPKITLPRRVGLAQNNPLI